MSDSRFTLPARPSLEQLRKQAKELFQQYRADADSALERFHAVHPGLDVHTQNSTLAEAQFVIAREYGFESWAKLKQHVGSLELSGLELHLQLAKDLAAAYTAGDALAVQTVNWNYGTGFGWDHNPVQMQRRLTTWFASEPKSPDLALADAERMVAHSYGFESWAEFAASVTGAAADPRSAPVFISSTPPFYKIDWKENRLLVSGPQSAKNWDTIVEVMTEHQITKLNACGMIDAAMKRLPQLHHLTHLDLGDSKQLTDAGISHLARMPQLQELGLGGRTSPVTDRGLNVLRALPKLRRFAACWTQGISDSGLANLSRCDFLEDVNLLGTPAGDGSIQALVGKRHLRRLRTGTGITDAGLALFHEFPIFKTWHGGEIRYELMSPEAEPNFLLIDGPFTDIGLASLQGLNGLFGLTFFWHCPAFTSSGLEALKHLPNLGFLGCQDAHCDNEAMRHISAIPRLRMLMGQGAVAGDDGFEALSASRTIEYIWGRGCPNLGSRGFSALASLPSLRGIALGCRNVDDTALSALPRFPALRELMPMDVSDAGFVHVGRCENLEALWCMYCQETGDEATRHIVGLSRLKTYYAGKTRITDRSLEILGRMTSLERLEFWQCAGITDSGMAHLAALPKLREINLGGLAGVTRAVMRLFPARVRVDYSG